MRLLVLCSESTRSPENPPRPHGLYDFNRAVERQCDVRLDIHLAVKLHDFKEQIRSSAPDAVFLLPHWDQPIDEVATVLADLAHLPTRPPLILLDQVDQTCSPYFSLMEHVDIVLKSQILRESIAYTRPRRSGYIFADYLENHLGYDLGGWHFGETLVPQYLSKLHLGWNFGVSRRVKRLMRWSQLSPVPWRRRTYDFNCRLGRQPENDHGWYATYRRFALERLISAARGGRCTGADRVSPTKYLWEMSLSRFVFSPFGWGEVCYRDYEAIALGSLLLKPSMEHLVTQPDIYVADETYIPVRWDLADLAEKCEWCLAHPDECQRIIANGRRVLKEYLDTGFVTDVKSALRSTLQVN